METKVVKWEKRRQAGGGEMEKGQPGGGGGGRKMRGAKGKQSKSEERSGVKRQKSREAR